MSLADQIRARLNDPTDVALNGGPYVEAIREVMNVCAKAELEARFELKQPSPVPAWVNDVRTAIATGLCITEECA